MIMPDKEWYNPVNVIYEFKRLESLGAINPKAKQYKKLKEAYVSAVSLIGMTSRLKLNFWLQIVDDKEGSPDIRTICFKPNGAVNEFITQDVEVVTFEQHSSDDIVEFLSQTKLSRDKSYDNLTNILCFVDKYVTVPSAANINKMLLNKRLYNKSPIIILGKLSQNKEEYKLLQIYPDISMDITFDLTEECRKITYPGGLKFKGRGKIGEEPKYVNDGNKIYPFEKLSLK